jgi:PilZ domain
MKGSSFTDSSASDSGHKRDQRVSILGELHGEVMVFQPMTIKEISRGGAQIETTFPLLLDSLHDFRLALGDRSVVIKARVVHSRVIDIEQELVMYRSGIEFIAPSEHVLGVITDFVQTIRMGRPADGS